MSDVQVLRELLERVEKATGPDREIDQRLMALNHFEDERFIGAYWDDGSQAIDKVWVDRETNEWRSTAPFDFTASIDAAVALVEKVLPGWDWLISKSDLNASFDAVVEHWDGEEFCGYDGKSAPLAVLCAVLAALISQHEQESGR